MMDFGWKKKAERLRMVILSAGHQMAKELSPVLSKTLEFYGRMHKSGDVSRDMTPEMVAFQEEISRLKIDEVERPMWEPVEIYGWKIEATVYLQNGQLWWLLHAMRPTEKAPSAKEVTFLDKVIEHLGADSKRDIIIGPRSGPANEPGLLPFGWWTWFNRWPLYEIQVNKNKKGKEMMRIVPLGAREMDGYQSIDALQRNTK